MSFIGATQDTYRVRHARALNKYSSENIRLKCKLYQNEVCHIKNNFCFKYIFYGKLRRDDVDSFEKYTTTAVLRGSAGGRVKQPRLEPR